jgi:hypothetical protein
MSDLEYTLVDESIDYDLSISDTILTEYLDDHNLTPVKKEFINR